MSAPAMQKLYRETVAGGLKEKFGYENVNQIPGIEKVVLNSGFGQADDRKSAAEAVIEDIGKITGQKAVPTRAKLSVSNFKLREDEVVGARVTLRGRQMWEFLDRFVNVAIPTIRDFRGLSPKTFDGRGNFTVGVSDHTIFPEIELDKVKHQIGFDISIVTSARTDDEARELLRMLGMPFREMPTAKPEKSDDQEEETPVEEEAAA
ncbi:MAG: 50S ribosomal protein L5 [Verrucomicrobiales bacterium]|nr:50S ribosomal protein L5 [Verrucomicrobiales bacterium]